MEFKNEFEKLKKENCFQHFTLVEKIYTDCI